MSRGLQFLPASERVAFLPKIQDFLEPENERNWRFRLELADQLSLLSPLFGGREVAAHLVPVSIRLLQDRVAEVRTAAADTLAHLAQRLSINTALLLSSPHSSSYDRARCLGGVGGGKDLLVPLAKDLVSCFARHSKWHQRQTYANVCRRLKYTFPGPVFLAHLLPALLELSGDPVANVRLAVAKALSDVSLPPFTPLAVQELCGSDFQEHKFGECECARVCRGGCFFLFCFGSSLLVFITMIFTDDDDDDEDDEDNNNDAEEDANYKRSSILRAMERLRHDRDRDVRQAAAASSSSTASVSSPTHAPPLFAAPLVTASSAVFPWCQAPGPTSAVNDAGLASASCLVTASNANAECAAK